MNATVKKNLKPTPAMLREWSSMLDEKGAHFRRADLADRLYPLTAPRNRDRADALADAIIHEAARAGTIVKDGHVHWKKVTAERKLLGGRTVPELDTKVDLQLSTRCPGKWVAVDLETGEAWSGESGNWKRAADSIRAEVRAAMENRQ